MHLVPQAWRQRFKENPQLNSVSLIVLIMVGWGWGVWTLLFFRLMFLQWIKCIKKLRAWRLIVDLTANIGLQFMKCAKVPHVRCNSERGPGWKLWCSCFQSDIDSENWKLVAALAWYPSRPMALIPARLNDHRLLWWPSPVTTCAKGIMVKWEIGNKKEQAVPVLSVDTQRVQQIEGSNKKI